MTTVPVSRDDGSDGERRRSWSWVTTCTLIHEPCLAHAGAPFRPWVTTVRLTWERSKLPRPGALFESARRRAVERSAARSR